MPPCKKFIISSHRWSESEKMYSYIGHQIRISLLSLLQTWPVLWAAAHLLTGLPAPPLLLPATFSLASFHSTPQLSICVVSLLSKPLHGFPTLTLKIFSTLFVHGKTWQFRSNSQAVKCQLQVLLHSYYVLLGGLQFQNNALLNVNSKMHKKRNQQHNGQ